MDEMLRLLIDRIDTPIGALWIVEDCGGQPRAVDWVDHETLMRGLLRRYYGETGYRLEPVRASTDASRTISAYFEGEVTAIERVPVRTAGTFFQHEVWRALRHIPCGTTVSYAQLAARIGRPAAVPRPRCDVRLEWRHPRGRIRPGQTHSVAHRHE